MILFVGAQPVAPFAWLTEEHHAPRLVCCRHPAVAFPGFPAIGVGTYQPELATP